MVDPVLKTLSELKGNGTFIQLRIPGSGYERIVVVSDIRTTAEMPLIAIDCPAEMATVLKSGEPRPRLNFEFTGSDKLRYHFTTRDAFIHGNTLLITVPEHIERVQRRDDFRIDAPIGAVFYFTAGDQRKRVKMLDISISGTSGILVCLKSGTPQPPSVAIGQTILNLKLAFALDAKQQLIPVRECDVRGLESLPQKGRYRMAVAFTRMDTDCRDRLTAFLYDQQRHLLKIRKQR